jgi:predicted permease
MPFRLEGLWRDMVFAARLGRRQLPSIATAVAALSLAIGLATAVVSVVNGQHLKEPGVVDSAGLLTLRRTRPIQVGEGFQFFPGLRYSEYLALGRNATAIRLAAASGAGVRIAGDRASVSASFVSQEYLELMGATPHVGRARLDGTERGILLSYGYWRTVLGGDSTVVGRTIRVNDAPFTVVGVLARGFTGPAAPGPAVWLPLEALPPVLSRTGSGHEPGAVGVTVYGRLNPGSTSEAAEAALAGRAAGLWPDEVEPGWRPLELSTVSESPRSIADRPEILTALAVVGLVMLLACGNVANILLGIGAMRRQEVGIRLALGASRSRLVRQWITESLALAIIGGGAGLALAFWLVPLLARTARVAPQVDIWPDARVFGFVLFVAMVSGLLAGLSPVRHATKNDLHGALQGGHRRLLADLAVTCSGRSSVLALQAGLALTLLALTALFARSAFMASRLHFGIDADRLLTLRAPIPTLGSSGGAFWQEAVRRALSVPGVEAAALSARDPLGGSLRTLGYAEGERIVSAVLHETSASYFDTVGLHLVYGRPFSVDEGVSRSPVAVVSERLARGLWGDANPIGRSLRRAGSQSPPLTVIGVVADIVPHDILRIEQASVFVPIGPDVWPVALVVRAGGDPGDVAQVVRSAVQSIDPAASVSVRFVSEEVERQRATLRIPLQLSLVASTVTLALATMGVHAVAGFNIRQRRREIGIRVALGASRSAVFRDLLRPSLRSAAMGLAGGLVTALVAGHLVSASLIGIEPFDLPAMAAAGFVLLAVALAGAAVPLSRSVNVDPAAELRQL